jgi:UDP-glucose 4-epimerase
VYGTPALLPLTEKEPLSPISFYGLDKKCAEDYARVGAALSPLRTIGLRFFNVYGERQDPKSPYSGVISLFMGALKEGRPLTILGNGAQTRDFVYVADVARALMASMTRLEGVQADRGVAEVYNVATQKQCSIQQLAEKIIHIASNYASIQYAEPRLGDIQHSLGDATALIEAMGWRPDVALEDGLSRLWNSLSGV